MLVTLMGQWVKKGKASTGTKITFLPLTVGKPIRMRQIFCNCQLLQCHNLFLLIGSRTVKP